MSSIKKKSKISDFERLTCKHKYERKTRFLYNELENLKAISN